MKFHLSLQYNLSITEVLQLLNEALIMHKFHIKISCFGRAVDDFTPTAFSPFARIAATPTVDAVSPCGCTAGRLARLQ
jgi:hypothetical protein